MHWIVGATAVLVFVVTLITAVRLLWKLVLRPLVRMADLVQTELSPNGGKSLSDRVDRIGRQIEDMEARLGRVNGAMGGLHTRIGETVASLNDIRARLRALEQWDGKERRHRG